MKRTSTRLATIGGVVLLVACAIAMAQHDSRNRDRAPLETRTTSANRAEIIPVGSDWESTAGSNTAADIRTDEEASQRFSLADDAPSLPPPAEPIRLPAPKSNPLRGAAYTAAKQPSIAIDNESRPGEPSQGEFLAADDSAAAPLIKASDFPEPNKLENSQTLSAPVRLASGEVPTDRPNWLQDRSLPGTSAKTPPPSNSSPRTPNPYSGPGLPSTVSSSSSLGDSPGTNTSSRTGSSAAQPQLPSLPGSGPTSTSRAGGNSSTVQAGPPSTFPSIPSWGQSTPDAPALPSSTSSQNSNPTINQPSIPPGRTQAPSQGRTLNDRPSIAQPMKQPQMGGASSYPQPPRNPVSSLSDTQRGVMTPTDMTRPQSAAQSPPPAGAGSVAYGSGFPNNSVQRTNGTQNSSSRNNGFPSNSVSQLPPAYPPQSATNSSPAQNSSTIAQDQYRATAGSNDVARTASRSMPSAGAQFLDLVSNRPGDRYLDGSQNPIMQIRKEAPAEIQVGKPATFLISVRNSGNAVAHGVTVLDSVPRGVKFVESTPPTRPDAQGMLAWKLGQIAANEEQTIKLVVVPEVQGEVGSVATVHFAARASVRTVATKPEIEVLLQGTPYVLIGSQQQVEVTLRNVGTGIARDLRLEADIPEQLQHASGDRQLYAKIGDLRPGETKPITFAAAAVAPGRAKCQFRVVNDDGIAVQEEVPVDVKSPNLVAQISGPKLRYLERQATYRIAVQNNGTAAATNVSFVARLPAGLKFNASDVNGQYDPNTHTVRWALHELPAGETAPVEITVLPVDLGPQVISFAAEADLEISTETKTQVNVDGLSELAFTIGQDDGTIEAGAISTYSVQIANVGNKADSNVQLSVELPNGAELVSVVNAPVEYRVAANQVVFAPISEVKHKDQYTYRFQIRHKQPGKQIVRTKLVSQNWPNAVVKEEGTLVYDDNN
jgi:uncharacterized repeat protein (TIGR01451 family)